MKIVSLLFISALVIGAASLLSTKPVHADSLGDRSAPKAAESYGWVVDYRSKPPFKRSRVAREPTLEPQQFASSVARFHDRVKVGPRGKTRLISRYRSDASAGIEAASFARFEETSDEATSPRKCKRIGAPGKSMPVLSRRC